MRLLGVDTATEACSVALWQDGALLSRCELAGRRHSEMLLPMIGELLAEAAVAKSQLDGLVAGVGPGSFVGVRVGVGLIKGMAMALDRPCVGASSLELLARGAASQQLGDTRHAAVAIDARMSEVYFAQYLMDSDGRLTELSAPQVCPPTEVVVSPDAGCLGGTGWDAYPAARQQLPEALRSIEVAALLPNIADGMATAAQAISAAPSRFDAAQLEPCYLRNRIALTLQEQQAQRQR